MLSLQIVTAVRVNKSHLDSDILFVHKKLLYLGSAKAKILLYCYLHLKGLCVSNKLLEITHISASD